MMTMMKVPPGVRDVVFESRFEAVTTQVSEEMMASPDTPFPFGKVTVSRRLSRYCHVSDGGPECGECPGRPPAPRGPEHHHHRDCGRGGHSARQEGLVALCSVLRGMILIHHPVLLIVDDDVTKCPPSCSVC